MSPELDAQLIFKAVSIVAAVVYLGAMAMAGVQWRKTVVGAPDFSTQIERWNRALDVAAVAMILMALLIATRGCVGLA